jgi:ribosomal-protein-alanine N-acetyltransferase
MPRAWNRALNGEVKGTEDDGPDSARYPMAVRPAEKDDIDQVLAIEELSFSNPWDHYYFRTSLRDVFLVYEEQGIQGFLVAVCCHEGIRGTIIKIAVHPDHRRKGIATELLNTALEILKARDISIVDLNVDMLREAAISLYEKSGFRITQTIRLDNEGFDLDDSFYVMELDLKQPGRSRN